MEQERISDAVARRLPGYYRHLRELEAAGVTRLSSRELGERMGLTASQIRQDINRFGGFGQQGYGYHVPDLKRCIGEIMGLDREHAMVICGAGNIGRAVAHYPTFRNEGFRVLALFDVDEALVGQAVQGAPILHFSVFESFLAEHDIEILVIATPAAHARRALEMASAAGVRAAWNFAPVDLSVPEGMEIANVHLSDSLMSLSFRLHERDIRQGGASKRWIKE